MTTYGRTENAYDVDDMNSRYTDFRVIVGNVGTVYAGRDFGRAYEQFTEYRSQSQSLVGRAGGESVTLIGGDDIVLEFHGSYSQE